VAPAALDFSRPPFRILAGQDAHGAAQDFVRCHEALALVAEKAQTCFAAALDASCTLLSFEGPCWSRLQRSVAAADCKSGSPAP